MNQRALGGSFEGKAADFLIKEGYQILDRNFRCRMGEIDIIARDGIYLVFVEVKFRSSSRYGGPLPPVDSKKQRTISKVAVFYLMKQGLPLTTPCRFDVVGILPDQIRLVKNAFPFRK